jgi:hypothetical protein
METIFEGDEEISFHGEDSDSSDRDVHDIEKFPSALPITPKSD